MRLIIKDTNALAGQWAANHIAERINAHQAKSDKPFVLGLPTGSSPLGVYRKLIEMNKAGDISFKEVTTVNLDEYNGLQLGHLRTSRIPIGGSVEITYNLTTAPGVDTVPVFSTTPTAQAYH